MTYRWKKYFNDLWEPKLTYKNQVYGLEEYDESYVIIKRILMFVGIRLTKKDSDFMTRCFNFFYWFEFVTLSISAMLEMFMMIETAQGGTFENAVTIFRMMPCMGYSGLVMILFQMAALVYSLHPLLLGCCDSSHKGQWSILPQYFSAVLKSYKMVYCRPVYENLISELRSMWKQGKVSEEEHRVISKTLTQLNIAVKGYYWCNNILVGIFLVPCYIDIIKRAVGMDVARYLPFYFWFPFDPLEPGVYEIVLVVQSWGAMLTIWFMLAGDLFFCVFLGHITLQFDLLGIRIRKMFYVPIDDQLLECYPLGDNAKNYEQEANIQEETNDKYQKEIIEIIRRHCALIRLSNDVEELFSFALFVNFFNSSIIICFCGFCSVIIENWSDVTYKSFLMTALSELWLLCWYGQKLLESSEEVSKALYNCGWYMASKGIKSSVHIMIHRAQRQVKVTTYGFSTICLASYTTIIKTSWSYFTLLLNAYKQ